MTYFSHPIAIAFLLLLSQVLFANDGVHIGAGEWPPYVSQHIAHKGPISKLVTDAFTAAEIDSQLVWLPWSGALRKAKKAQLNAIFPWYKSKSRERDFLFSEPLSTVTTAIFHLKDMPFDWQTLQDLKPYRIGVNTDYFYSEAFSEAENKKSLNITRVDSKSQLIGMLLRGRLDIILMAKTPQETFLQQVEGSEQLTSHFKAFAKKQIYVLFPKADPKSKERLAAFNKGLYHISSQQPALTLQH